ncbi:carbohydrate ABC transporter permease, partial [Listeria monocytogenes]|nr:carbohydrate ABC transporter permease [Listeria monocytogenes]
MKNKKISVGKLCLHGLLAIGSFLMVFPFLWTIGSSLKNMTQIFAIPPVWFPNPIVWQNYLDSLQAMPFG